MPKELSNTTKKRLDVKNDDKLFKKEKGILCTDLETERPADIHKPCTHEELNNSICDHMVREIVDPEQGEDEEEKTISKMMKIKTTQAVTVMKTYQMI